MKMFKKKKDVVKIIDEAKEKMVDKNFEERILREHYGVTENKKVEKSNLFKLRVAISALSCVLIIAIVLPCIFLFTAKKGPSDQDIPGEPDPDEPIYTWQDENTDSSTVEQVNKYLEGYELNVAYVTDVVVSFDKDTGDDFYFVIAWYDETGKQGRIYVVVNKLYDDSLWDKPTDKEISVNGLTVCVKESVDTYPEYGLYVHNVYAKTNIGNVTVYFEEYIESSFSEENTFAQFVEEIFIKK